MKVILPLILVAGFVTAQERVCPKFVDKFPGYTCPGTIPNNAFHHEWSLETVDKRGEQFEYSMLVRDISDPEKKARIMRHQQWVQKYPKDFIFTAKQSFSDENWQVDIIDINFIYSLEYFFKRVFKESFTEFSRIFQDLAEKIAFFHDKKIILANLKNEEYLYLNPQLNSIHFIDLSDATDAGTPIDGRGDFRFWEPSRFATPPKPDTFDEQVDIYAFGLVLYRSLRVDGLHPFDASTREETQKLITAGKLTFPKGTHADFAYLVIRCMNSDRSTRPNIKSVLALMTFLNENEKKIEKSLLPEEITIDLNLPPPEAFVAATTPDFFSFSQTLAPLSNAPSVSNFDIFSWPVIVSAAAILVILIVILIVVLCAKKTPQDSLQTHLDDTTSANAPAQDLAPKSDGPQVAVT